MSEAKNGAAKADAAEKKPMTSAQAADLVDCKTKEVLDFKEFDDRVVVVTIAGQKLVGKKK